jgi:hypothetical protein
MNQKTNESRSVASVRSIAQPQKDPRVTRKKLSRFKEIKYVKDNYDFSIFAKCITLNPDGTYNATFGYDSNENFSWDQGGQNKLTPAIYNTSSEPIFSFSALREEEAFTVLNIQSNHKIKWRIGHRSVRIGSDFRPLCESSSLPIELLSFDGESIPNSNKQVRINWATASELNNDYFRLEASTNGYNWSTVKTVDGAGNSSQTLYYTQTLNLNAPGVWYFRLSQFDFDGESETFDAISINVPEQTFAPVSCPWPRQKVGQIQDKPVCKAFPHLKIKRRKCDQVIWGNYCRWNKGSWYRVRQLK